MSFEEKNAFVSLFTCVVIFSIYFAVTLPVYSGGGYDGLSGIASLGKAITLLIVAGIVLQVVLSVGVNILHAILTNEPKPDFTTDERDRMIELRAEKAGMFFQMLLAVTGFVLLWRGVHLYWVFNTLLLAHALPGFAEGVSKITMYRTGL